MKIKLIVQYDGSDFYGWQKQPNKRTCQQTLEDAIFSVTGERVTVTGSGRTDAGTHALMQVASFSVKNATIPPERYSFALNVVLPNDLKVTGSSAVSDNFNARTNAKRKTYVYSMYRSYVEEPLKERYCTRINERCDFNKMKELAQIFVGTHDFKCLLASGSEVKDTVRTIYAIDLKEKGKDITVTVTGNGFLYNMVRILVGALVAYSEGVIKKETVEKALETGDRTILGDTMPAKGLCLVRLEYDF